MKVVTTLLIAVGLGLAVYAARRRLKLALTVAGVAYVVMLPIRLLFSAGDLTERVDDLVWPLFFLLLLWLPLWYWSTRVEEQKARQPRPLRKWWTRLRD